MLTLCYDFSHAGTVYSHALGLASVNAESKRWTNAVIMGRRAELRAQADVGTRREKKQT